MTPTIYLSTVAVSASADDTQAKVEVEDNGDGDDEVVNTATKAKDAANKEDSEEAVREEGLLVFADPPNSVPAESMLLRTAPSSKPPTTFHNSLPVK